MARTSTGSTGTTPTTPTVRRRGRRARIVNTGTRLGTSSGASEQALYITNALVQSGMFKPTANITQAQNIVGLALDGWQGVQHNS